MIRVVYQAISEALTVKFHLPTPVHSMKSVFADQEGITDAFITVNCMSLARRVCNNKGKPSLLCHVSFPIYHF